MWRKLRTSRSSNRRRRCKHLRHIYCTTACRACLSAQTLAYDSCQVAWPQCPLQNQRAQWSAMCEVRLTHSYTVTIAQPHAAELTMRGPLPLNMPLSPSSRRIWLAIALKVLAWPSALRATWT